MRQILRQSRDQRREITLDARYPGDMACVDASGAIKLTLHDFIPTVDNSLGLPPGLEIDLGVTGDQVWPVSISDVTVEEEDETSSLTDQELGFAQTEGARPVRTTITVIVSNAAIDSAGFDLLGYVQGKFALAQRRYIAMNLYCTDGGSGPFSDASQWVMPSDGIYNAIIGRMKSLESAGYDTADAVIIMDYNMEARLKTTPIRQGEACMVIERGMCCGYPYIANRYFNATKDPGTGKHIPNSSDAIGIGLFKWFKVSQHGKARLTVDGVSKEVAERNVTSVTINTAWSFHDVSAATGATTGAFAMLYMQRVLLADNGSIILRASDGGLLSVGKP